MPWQKGNRLGGRKGYEYEQKQLEKFRKLLNKYIGLAEKTILAKEKNHLLEWKINLLQSTILKIMDKLHVSKESNELILPIPLFDYVRNNNRDVQGAGDAKKNTGGARRNQRQQDGKHTVIPDLRKSKG